MKSTARAALASIDVLKPIQKCKVIVTLCKRWGIMKDLEISLKQENDTRWNSVLIMLLSFPRNFEKVNEHLSERGRSELLLSEEDQRKILKLIAFLQVFKTHTEKLEADKKPTLQYVMPVRIELLKHCQPVPDDSPGMKNIREKAKALIEQKLVLSDHQKFATFLWPKYRRLSKLSQEERTQIHKKMSEKVAAYSDKNDTLYHSSSPKRPKLDDEYSSWTESEGEEEGQADEVMRYLQDIPGDVIDLAQWWKEKGNILYPDLAKVARTILCIPATSAPSERVFSTAGCVITNRRASLDPQTVDHILFLNSWFKQ